ncbi:MAG TPA: FAD-dependent oxidoreductase [Ktedonobacterales bacterium]|nr:FAD-dependent oxidoreductase [Ktedonobacterales bacterium]
MSQRNVVVIGAGMAGLAAARWLAAHDLAVTVFERGDRVGGRVRTDNVGGVQIDLGAQILARFGVHTHRLFADVGLAPDLLRKPSLSGIARAGHIYELKPSLSSLLSGLLSPLGKATFLKLPIPLLSHWSELDVYDLGKAAPFDTGSLAAYARRVLDDEVLEYLLQPLLSGLLYWTPERTSEVMLLLLMKVGSAGFDYDTVHGGLAQLPEAAARSLDVYCDSAVTRVTRDGADGYTVFARTRGEERAFPAAGVVCATSAGAVPQLFPDLDPAQHEFFDAITYSSTAVAVVGLKQRLPISRFSVFFPRREAKHAAAVTIAANKDLSAPPLDGDTIQIYASGPSARDLLERDDVTIRDTLWSDLQRAGLIQDFDSSATFWYVHRWPLALPEFDVGHFRRLKAFADGTIESGRIVFAGDYLGGPYVEGAVYSGERAAERLLQRLESAPAT